MSGETIEAMGVVLSEHRGGHYTVRLDPPVGSEVLLRLCGRMSKSRIRVLPGDRVRVELSPYDTSRGRIVFRERAA